MRVFFGMILGALLTVGVAFVHDNWSSNSSSTTTGSASLLADARMVNWDVVGANWRIVKDRARDTWTMLSQKVQS
jgi:hypothetical protein